MYGGGEATELTRAKLRREEALKLNTTYFQFVSRNVAVRQCNSGGQTCVSV